MSIPTRKYYPEVDGLRGAICMLIIWQHCHFSYLNIPFTIAVACLHTFFIISGFLITSILLKDKERNLPINTYLKNYYLRRVFRIFPLYFAYVGLMAFLAIVFPDSAYVKSFDISGDIRENWQYLVTYTYNLKEYFSVVFDHPYRSSLQIVHLWSLSMEEQFYLVIPFLVYYLSLKNLRRVAIFILCINPLIRIAAAYWMKQKGLDDTMSSFIMERHSVLQLDVIMYGVALALFDFSWIKKPQRWVVAGLVVYVLYTYVNGYFLASSHDWYGAKSMWQGVKHIINQHDYIMYNGFYGYMFSFMNITLALLVYCLISGMPFFTKLLSHPTVIQAGKYSYGMYVWQMIVISIAIVLQKFLPKFLQKSIFFEIFAIVLVTILSYWIAKISYEYFEKYFLKYKDRYM